MLKPIYKTDTVGTGSVCVRDLSVLKVLRCDQHGVRLMVVSIKRELTASNSNRTEWSPISVCNHTSDNKNRQPRSGSPICLSQV